MPKFTFPASATTTATRGRVITSSRHHHYVVDEPEFLGGPGEAPGAHEYFLMGVAGCAAALTESFAHHERMKLVAVDADVEGVIDPGTAPRQDLNMFAKLSVSLTFHGLDDAAAARLVELYKQRCPIYGTVAAGAPVEVHWSVRPA